MPITSLLFTVGGVPFFDFEAPEILESLGGTQRYAEHDFPGGVRTQQTFGAFPSDITWRGIFTGTDAMVRWRTVDRLRVAGEEVALAYGTTVLFGLVTEFEATPKHQWLIPYKMKFCPRLDISSMSPFDELLSAVSLINSALGALSELIAIAEGLFSSGGTTLTFVDITSPIYFPMPPTMVAPVTSLINTTVDALQAALGIPADISFNDAAAIQAAGQAVLDSAQPYILGDDPTLSSPAADVVGYSGTIMSAVSPATSGQTQLQTINPNLFMISTQYFGTPYRWQDIAIASGLPIDPLPTGEFTLTIPSS